jgi:hypothetical protein
LQPGRGSPEPAEPKKRTPKGEAITERPRFAERRIRASLGGEKAIPS